MNPARGTAGLRAPQREGGEAAGGYQNGERVVVPGGRGRQQGKAAAPWERLCCNIPAPPRAELETSAGACPAVPSCARLTVPAHTHTQSARAQKEPPATKEGTGLLVADKPRALSCGAVTNSIPG